MIAYEKSGLGQLRSLVNGGSGARERPLLTHHWSLEVEKKR